VSPSPVVELNRALAVGMAGDPAAGIAILDDLRDSPGLRAYAQLPAARGHLLERLGRLDEARAAFEAAAGLTRNAGERAMFERRASALL
jgi:predicted RNA polymerase sigma factor